MTDNELIELYKNGNDEAFKKLIEKYSSSIYNFTYHITGKNNASDIVQEVFIKVWKNINRFNPSKSSFKTWIFIIAKNSITDFLRKKKQLNFSDIKNYNDDYSFSENIADENLLPDQMLQKLQDSEFLNNLLEKLSLQYKTILILHYQEEMTFDEIGKTLSKPTNTIKSYHRRAILELRNMITTK
ncbi:MAG: sigma-70 family RNA polymerase sigma factor [Candidatus Paceibacterota bacterium]|jgi:RNA polymerase sigma-70 factor (ECF subfamily)